MAAKILPKTTEFSPVSDDIQHLENNSVEDVLGATGVDFISIYNQYYSDVTIFEHSNFPSKADTNSHLWHLGCSWKIGTADGRPTIGSGTVKLNAIENIHYFDSTYPLYPEIDDNAEAALALLYAAFDNTPDAESFRKWITNAEVEVAKAFSKPDMTNDK